jgi:predicted PurR-regulated permease PerM
MKTPNLLNSITTSIEVSIRLIFLFILIAWCLMLLYPFLTPVIWGVIIAVVASPLYIGLKKKLGGSSKITSFLLVVVSLIIIIYPAYLIIDSIANNLNDLADMFKAGDLVVPPPDEKIIGWPLIGQKSYDFWKLASTNLTETLTQFQTQLAAIGEWLLKAVMGFTLSILQFALSIIIAGILLATEGTNDVTRKFFRKLVGDKGDEFTDITEKTIRNVTKGILGVAIIQAVALGILFLLAGVPYVGIWVILCMILAIIQIGPGLVSIPIIIYLYSTTDPLMATVWAVLIMLTTVSDSVLKPIMLGKGAPVPMLVIFLGSIGGFIVSGFLGLFTGAIVLSIGYTMFISWLDIPNPDPES